MAIELYSKATLDTLLAAKLEDAPSDGSQYARQDGAWAVVTGGGGTLAADQLTAGVVTANPTAGPTSYGEVLKYSGSGTLIWESINVALAAPQLTLGLVTSNPGSAPSTDGQVLSYSSTGGDHLEWVSLPPPPVKSVNNIDMGASDYYPALTDANNIVNVSAGDGSSSGYVIKIPAESSVNFPVGTEILFTCSMSSGSSYNYINGDSGVTVIQASNGLNATFMRNAVKLGSDLWMISAQI